MARLFKLFLLHLFFFLGASVLQARRTWIKLGMGRELQGLRSRSAFSPLSSVVKKMENSHQPLVVSPPETDIVVTMDWHRTQQR